MVQRSDMSSTSSKARGATMKLHVATCRVAAPAAFSHAYTRSSLQEPEKHHRISWHSARAPCQHPIRLPLCGYLLTGAACPLLQHTCRAAPEPIWLVTQQLTTSRRRHVVVQALPSKAGNAGRQGHSRGNSKGLEGQSDGMARRNTASSSTGAGPDRACSASNSSMASGGCASNVGQRHDAPPCLENRRSITSMQHLLVCVLQQRAPLTHAAMGQVCIMLNRLIQKHERAQQAGRTAHRRAHRLFMQPNTTTEFQGTTQVAGPFALLDANHTQPVNTSAMPRPAASAQTRSSEELMPTSNTRATPSAATQPDSFALSHVESLMAQRPALPRTLPSIPASDSVVQHSEVGVLARLQRPPVPLPGPLQLKQKQETATIMYQATLVLQHVLQICEPLKACTDALAACQLIEAMGAVHYQGMPAQQLAGVLHAMQPLLPQLPSHCLAKLLWGLGRLQYQPPHDWMQAVLTACASHSGSMGTWATVKLLDGLARLQAAMPVDVHGSSGLWTILRQDIVQESMRRLQPHLAWLTPGQQAGLLLSTTALGVQPSVNWLKDFEQRSSSKLPGLTVEHASQLAVAMFKLRYVPSKWWLRRYWHYSLCAMRFAGIPYTYDSTTQQDPGKCSSYNAASGSRRTTARSKDSSASAVAGTGSSEVQRPGAAQQPQGTVIPADVMHAAVQDAVMRDITHILDMASSLARLNLDFPKPWVHHALAVVRGLPPPLPQTTPRPLYAQGMPRFPQQTGSKMPQTTLLAPPVSLLLPPPGSTQPLSQRQPAVSATPPHEGGTARFQVQLPPVQAVQAVYIVAKYRDNPAVARHVSWARTLLKRLLSDLVAVQRGSWSAKEGQHGNQDMQPQPSRTGVYGQQEQHATGYAGLHMGCTQRLVDVLYACAELKELPRADRMDALLQDMQRLLPSTSTSQCATIMVCLAVLRFSPTSIWCASFFEHMYAHLKAFSVQELANTLTAAAYLGLDPGADVLAHVHQAIRNYSLVQLAMMVRKLQATPAAVAQQAAWLAILQADSTRLLSSMSR